MKKLFGYLTISVAAFLWAGHAQAQTACPQGVGAGSAQCGPGGGGMAPAPRRQPVPRWISTWGAYAEAHGQPIVGTSKEQRSEHAAKRAAIKRCKKMGGKTCEVVFTYTNNCAAVAAPIENLPSMIALYQSAPSVAEATEIVLPVCARTNNGHACHVVHSNCSKPYLVYD
ncbi:DUF4189 domain-containing protein [Luteimonas marina]|nr:DUF4189 domain-containing protein [Luteimonas marina]